MYFLIIMAFAFVLSEGLPPQACNLMRPWPITGTLLVVAAQIVVASLVAAVGRRKAVSGLDGTAAGHDRAVDSLSRTQQALIGVLTASLVFTMVCTPWIRLIRQGVWAVAMDVHRDRWWTLGRLPLIPDILIVAPLFLSLLAIWIILYGVEARIRETAIAHELEANSAPPHATLGAFLADKFRHHVLIIAAPMFLIVFAKHFTDRYAGTIVRTSGLPWAGDLLLGAVSICVLVISPLLLRYIWVTQPMPAGPLRDRFDRTCGRVGLRYRQILVWNTHGLTLNAAVMGFVPRLRYILVSDALLDILRDDEIEAVFGHEAGHVRHWHLHYFGLFAMVSIFVSGGALELLNRTGMITDYSSLNLIAVAVLLACWLLGFGWLSRKFERQADLFGVRCITPDIASCVAACPVHGGGDGSDSVATSPRPGVPVKRQGTTGRDGLCRTAANTFGRTLAKIADLNGVPRHAGSWRHGSIQSRCDLIEQFANDPGCLRRFDRKLMLIKAGLVIAVLLGSAGACTLYYPQLARAFTGMGARPSAVSRDMPPGVGRTIGPPARSAQDARR